MKTNGLKTMSFGFSAVNAGQRNVVVDPEVIAVSTEGNFRITGPVSKALGIASGDYVMFLSNVDEIDNAIANKADVVTEFCKEQGLEVGSVEAAIAIHKEFDMWAIAKGFVEYDAKGNQRTCTERLTKKDKVKFASQNYDAMFEAAMASDNEEIKETLSDPEVSKEDKIDILSTFVVARELPKHKGSKTANAAGMTGTGVSLNFTDSNVWKQLKADMGDDATKVNRVFSVDLDNIIETEMNDGYKTITVKILVLGAFVDKEPARIGGKSEE